MLRAADPNALRRKSFSVVRALPNSLDSGHWRLRDRQQLPAPHRREVLVVGEPGTGRHAARAAYARARPPWRSRARSGRAAPRAVVVAHLALVGDAVATEACVLRGGDGAHQQQAGEQAYTHDVGPGIDAARGAVGCTTRSLRVVTALPSVARVTSIGGRWPMKLNADAPASVSVRLLPGNGHCLPPQNVRIAFRTSEIADSLLPNALATPRA